MTSFRFVHTGDIHLDSPLKGLADYERGAAERIRMATREAFDNLVSQVIDEEASFVVIAGDLYDGDWRDYQTGLYFIRQMGRLARAQDPRLSAVWEPRCGEPDHSPFDPARQCEGVLHTKTRNIRIEKPGRCPPRPGLSAARH